MRTFRAMRRGYCGHLSRVNNIIQSHPFMRRRVVKKLVGPDLPDNNGAAKIINLWCSKNLYFEAVDSRRNRWNH